MFKLRLVILCIVCVLLMGGCVVRDSSLKTSDSPYASASEKERRELVQQYLTRGRALENEGRLTSAFEKYKLALTVDPENAAARQNKSRMMELLRKRADYHYQRGLQFDNAGQYEAGRNEYLSALQKWPEHQAVKERLTGRIEENEKSDYIIHTLKYGENVSLVSKLYYGSVKKYDVIGKFNNMKDVTKVKAGDRLKIPAIGGITVPELKKKQTIYLNPPPKNKIETEPESEKQATESPLPEPVDKTSSQQVAVSQEVPVETPAEKLAAIQPDKKENIIPQATIFHQEGKKMLAQKKYTGAIEKLSKAHQLDSQDQSIRDDLFQALFQNGLALFRKKTYLGARDQFKSALKVNPSCDKCQENIEKSESVYIKTHYDLGTYYFGNENLEKAIEEWKQVKALDPDYKQVTPNLKRAEALYKRWIEIKERSTQ